MKKRALLLTATMIGLLSPLASEEPPAKKPPRPDHLVIAGGVFDFNKSHHRPAFQLEYLWDVNWYHVRPLVTLLATDRGSLFAGAGAGLDIIIGKRFVIMPSFAPGLYYKGNGKKLGFPLEFRSSLEFSLMFKNKARFGWQIHHLSNASLSSENPGANSWFIFLAIPIK